MPHNDEDDINAALRGDYEASGGTGWFVGIIVALALLAIGYLVFSASSETCEQYVCITSVEGTP